MYRDTIREELARQGHIGMDPRHIEAFMRSEHGCLDGLSKSQFSAEVKTAADCVLVGGVGNAESVAQSFGL